MSLRRRVTLVFVAVNAFTLVVLLFYVRGETDRTQERFDRSKQALLERTAELLPISLILTLESIEEQLREKFRGASDDTVAFAIDIGNLSYWDEDPYVLQHLDKAMLITFTETETLPFNPRRRLRFEDSAGGAIDKSEIRRLVTESKRFERTADVEGRPIVYGPLDLGSDRDWGFYFRLKQPPAEVPFDPVGSILWITVPGAVFLLGVIYLLLSRSFLRPLAQLEAAALRTSAGDYDEPLDDAGRRDEIGSVARAMNRMMRDLANYRSHMEGLVTDATERFKAAERSLQVAQRLAAMGQLAAGIAHEINNPLGGILNSLERLGRDDLAPEKRAKSLRIAREATERIRGTVQRVLAAAPRQPRLAAVRLERAVDDAVALIRHRLDSEGIVLDRTGLDLEVWADQGELVQAFLNLFINAADAMGGEGTITIRARTDGEDVEIRIGDDGCGMSPDVRDRAFDLFFTTKPGNEGTGLGLGIVHGIVTGHGGTIAVESEPGRGTEFTIRLPSRPAPSA